jgi:hypothetical protein
LRERLIDSNQVVQLAAEESLTHLTRSDTVAATAAAAETAKWEPSLSPIPLLDPRD